MAFPLFAAAGALALRFAPSLLRAAPRAAPLLRRPLTVVGPGILRRAPSAAKRVPPLASNVGFKKQALIFGGSTVAGGALGGVLSGRGATAGVQDVVSPIAGAGTRFVSAVLGSAAGATWGALPDIGKGIVLTGGGIAAFIGYKAIRTKLKT